MSEFMEANLAEIQETIVDNRGRSCPTSATGTALIATNCIKDDERFPIFENVRYVSEETMRTWFRGHPEPNDIIFVCKGSPGRAALAPDPVNFAIAQDMVALRPRKDIVDPRYLYYLLSTPQTRDSISDLHVGTLIPHFKKHDFAQLKLRLHKDRAAQQAIAEVLGALDDKIAANRALVATTLDLGSAICERAAQTGRSAQVADVAEFHNRKRIPLSARERSERLGSVPYWGANGQLGWVDEAIFDDNYVLIGEDGSVVTEQGTPVIHNLWGPAWVNNHAHVLSGKGISTDLLYFVLRRAHVADAVTGAVQPKLSMGKLKAVQIRLPDDSALPKVDARATSLLQQTRALEAESATLASLRDTLLPALMDGTIRVKDAIATAEEVL